MRHHPQHLLDRAGCEATPCGVLARARTFQVRTLTAALPGAVLARHDLDNVPGGGA